MSHDLLSKLGEMMEPSSYQNRPFATVDLPGACDEFLNESHGCNYQFKSTGAISLVLKVATKS
jgi:hypothetical protein